MYYLWCLERKAWWKPAMRGYTFNIEEAGKYTEEQTIALLETCNMVSRQEWAIPVEAVQNIQGLSSISRDTAYNMIPDAEVCSECGTENPECGWTLMRNHDPSDRTCFHCAPPPYGDGKNLKGDADAEEVKS